MRHELTWAEKILWKRLRDRKVEGLKFRRQQPMGNYILDFYCADAKMAVELDGGQHDIPEEREYDLRRTQWLEEEGIKVLRFWNSQIRGALPWVLESIGTAAGRGKTPSPRPSPLKGEGEEEKRPSPRPSPLKGEGEEEKRPSPRPSPLKGEGEEVT
jgi:adenine-specific DNA-methyltransferase